MTPFSDPGLVMPAARNPFQLAPAVPAALRQPIARSGGGMAPRLNMPRPDASGAGGSASPVSALGLLAALKGMGGGAPATGLGSYALPAASYNGIGAMTGPGGLLAGGV